MSTSAAGDPATYGGRATKYLPFTGPGTRALYYCLRSTKCK